MSSEWIDDTLNPARKQASATYDSMKELVCNMARGCRDRGATEKEAVYFAVGLLYSVVPNMIPLFELWVKEVYADA